MLIISRKDLAANLAAYGETEASSRIEGLSDEDFESIGKIGFQHALAGKHWLHAGCLAAIEVLESAPRELKRKRRKWDDVESQLCEPDPKMVRIHEWFNAYASGRPVKKQHIFDSLASALALYLPDYRYYKSFTHFRKPFQLGTSYIGFVRGHGVVALRFGVQHAEIERIRTALFGKRYLSGHNVRTISMYTVNMGPNSHHWPYPVEPEWPISGSEGLQRACTEVVSFVQDAVLPYVEAHKEPSNIRETLLTTPGRADPFDHAQTIFAIDYYLRNRDWLESDYAVLKERYRNYSPERKNVFEREFAVTTQKWDEII